MARPFLLTARPARGVQFPRQNMRPLKVQNVDSSADTDPKLADTRLVDTIASDALPISDVRLAPQARPLPARGERIADTYEILGVLGGGGMGVVLSALDERLGRKVAIKLIHA